MKRRKEYRLGLSASGGEAAVQNRGWPMRFRSRGRIPSAGHCRRDDQGAAGCLSEGLSALQPAAVQGGRISAAARSGNIAGAVDADPSVADMDLANRLGIQAGGSAEADDSSDVVDGKSARSAWEAGDGEGSAEVERPENQLRRRRRNGSTQRRNPDEDHSSAEPSRTLQGLRKSHRRRNSHVRPAGLRQNASCPRHRRRDQGGIYLRGHQRRRMLESVAGQQRTQFCISLFQQARRNRPCVFFFDEVDALAASRADMRTSGGRHLINQFLAEMDGVQSSNDGVLILAATNAPWHVDSAFRRPGRFDRILFVPPPDGPARSGIPRVLTKGEADRKSRLRSSG